MVVVTIPSFEDSELECDQGKGVYLSATAVVLFFVASCLLCCSPRADPFCFNFGREHQHATKTVEQPANETVVLQPIVIVTEDNSDSKPKKKNNKKTSDKV